MRSSALIAASLASNALAVPMLNKRGVVVTDLDIVTVTKYVTATGPCPTTGVTNTIAVTQEAVTSSMVEVTSYTSVAETPAVVVPAPVSSVVAGFTSVVESISSAVESVATSIYVAPSSEPAPVTTTASPTYAPVTSEAPSSTPSPSTTEAATTSSVAGGFSSYSFCPTTSVVSTASLTAQPTGTVQRKWLAYHNAHRANHTDGCSMYWDYDLEAKAQESANTCVYEHTVSSTDNFGQNMGQFQYTTSVGTVNDTTMDNSPAFFSNMYYEEYNDFGPYWGSASVPTEGPNILHFTQMVWKNSFSVGCATAKCSNDQQMITFCNYRSRGNILDEYGTNVPLFIDSPHKPLCAEISSDATDGSCITDAELGI